MKTTLRVPHSAFRIAASSFCILHCALCIAAAAESAAAEPPPAAAQEDQQYHQVQHLFLLLQDFH